MSGARQKNYAIGSLVVLAVGFIAAVIASNSFLRGIKLDLTENKLYTLAPGTRAMLAELEEPINLYYFFSDESTAEADATALRSYATRVEEMLEEFADVSNGQLRLQIIDPEPFSEAEDRAAQFGLADLGLGSLGGDSIYFGLAANNTVGDEAIVDVFDPSPRKQASLEYDLARLIWSLATPDKSVVGLISGLPITGGFDPNTQQIQQPWIMTDQIRQLFELRSLAADFSVVDDDISLLWIVHPAGLSENALYAIDQFVLGGGRALVFVDPMADAAAMMADPTGLPGDTSSTLEPLFSAWGVEFDPTRVVADNENGLSVQIGPGQVVRHIGMIGLGPDAVSADEITTAGLESGINFATAGSISAAADAAINLIPLIWTSTDSALMPSSQFQFLSDPMSLLDIYTADADTHVLAARIEGPLTSAFPDGPPGQADAAPAHISSSDNSNLIVVADVDVLTDRLWVQLQRSLLGGEIASAFANNGDFVANAVANLAGSDQLIGLKSRETYIRPFDRVQDLQREADARFRAREQELQAQLAATEQRLGDLQQAREDQGSLFMSPEQEQEIDRFRDEQRRTREELRAVQRELNSSIDNLGARLKLANIILFPIGLAVLALLVHLGKRRRKRGSAA